MAPILDNREKVRYQVNIPICSRGNYCQARSVLERSDRRRPASSSPSHNIASLHSCSDKMPVARIGARLFIMHNTVRRLELEPLNFAEEKRSRRRQAWTEGWEGDRQAPAWIFHSSAQAAMLQPRPLQPSCFEEVSPHALPFLSAAQDLRTTSGPLCRG